MDKTDNINIDGRIKKIMSLVFDVDVDQINNASSPDTIPQWDSLGHMNLIVALEEEFNITFNAEQLSEMLSFELIQFSLQELLE